MEKPFFPNYFSRFLIFLSSVFFVCYSPDISEFPILFIRNKYVNAFHRTKRNECLSVSHLIAKHIAYHSILRPYMHKCWEINRFFSIFDFIKCISIHYALPIGNEYWIETSINLNKMKMSWKNWKCTYKLKLYPLVRPPVKKFSLSLSLSVCFKWWRDRGFVKLKKTNNDFNRSYFGVSKKRYKKNYDAFTYTSDGI